MVDGDGWMNEEGLAGLICFICFLSSWWEVEVDSTLCIPFNVFVPRFDYGSLQINLLVLSST